MRYSTVVVLIVTSIFGCGCYGVEAAQGNHDVESALDGAGNSDSNGVRSRSLHAFPDRMTFEFDIVESGESITLKIDFDSQQNLFRSMMFLTPWGQFFVPDDILREFTHPDLFFGVDYALSGSAHGQSLTGFALSISFDPILSSSDDGQCDWHYSDAYISVDRQGIENIEVVKDSDSSIVSIFERAVLPSK